MSSPPERIVQSVVHEDAARPIKFMAMKAAIVIVIPLVAPAIAVWWRFG